MPDSDRQKWNAKYTQTDVVPTEPSSVLARLSELIPQIGRAIDVAGGAGRHAVWLAQHGLEVTLADISPVGLALATDRAEAARVSISTAETDLEAADFPSGPWDVIFSHHFLWRSLYDVYPDVLAEDGTLVVIQPTVTNLERHDKPPRQFLLADGELPTLVAPLEIVHYEEGWLAEGRHEAVAVAKRRRG